MVAQSGQQIAQGLTNLADQHRLGHLEDNAQRQREKNKSPSDYFDVGSLKKIKWWCQVANETSLPPIYATIAKTKKGHTCAVLESALEEALVTLSYPRGYPVSTKLAKDILDLNWGTQATENLAHGLNIFNMGPTDVMDVAAQ